MKKLRAKSPKQLKNHILIITFVFLAILFTYGDIVASVRESHNSIVNSIKEKQFDNIVLYFDELQMEAYNNAIKVSKNIESGIKENISNIGSLKQEMDNDIIPEELYNILESNAKGVKLGNVDNTRNGILILDNKKVLVDFNYERINSKKINPDRTFENERNMQWNKQLYDNAIKNIFNKSNCNIAIETVESDNKDHKRIPNASEEKLKSIYYKEGIGGFKTYQFLVPAYITEDGDIFGQKDISNGIMQKNHKFIVIQEFNLYDQILLNHKEFENTDTEKELLTEHGIAVNVLNILGCLLILTYLIVIVILVNEYNIACSNNDDKP